MDKYRKLLTEPQPTVNPQYRLISVAELRALIRQRDDARRDRDDYRSMLADVRAAVTRRR